MTYDAPACDEISHRMSRAQARPNSAMLVKRVFDVGVTLLILACISPILLVLVLLVGMDGGPCLFRHERVGAGGRIFRCLKFRTMVLDNEIVLARFLAERPEADREWRTTQKLRHDPRVTPVGRFLRGMSLDELPQLLNVLAGDMSLVGPRPITRQEVARYGTEINWYYAVLPGITGLWQTSGRNDISYDERVRLDVAYVREWSFGRDISILIRTVPAVLSRDGAY